MEKEIWKDVVGNEKTHEVSNLGNIRGFKRMKILKPILMKRKRGSGLPYFYVALPSKNEKGKQQLVMIHRVVALTFLKNPKKLPQVNHIDGNKSNNSVLNLEWVDMAANMKHAGKNNLMRFGDYSPRSKLSFKKVGIIKNLLNRGVTHKNIAKRYGVDRSTITAINCGVTWYK
jgi:hypothetical protein